MIEVKNLKISIIEDNFKKSLRKMEKLHQNKKAKTKDVKEIQSYIEKLELQKNCPASLEESYQFTKDVYFCTNFENFIDLSCQRCHCRAWFFTHEYANE